MKDSRHIHSSIQTKTPPGLKHWLFQIVPPLSMLTIFITTTKGAALVFISGIFVLPVLISLISILVKLIFFKKRKYFLPRPILTVLIFIFILSVANWTYQKALQEAIDSARIIHRDCNENSICPKNPEGWEVDRDRIFRNDLGTWLTYSASYYYSDQESNIRVYQGPDMGDIINVGVGIPFSVTRYHE